MTDKEILDYVKIRLGIFYDDEVKNAEITGLISAAKTYFNRAGWAEKEPSPLFLEATVLYCKLSLDTDPKNLTNHPVLISYVAQGRGFKDDS